MIPDDAKYYPWQIELWEHAKAQKVARDGRSATMDWNFPDAKFSDLLRCLKLARDTPEIWDRIVEISGPDTAIDEDYNNEMSEFVGSFCEWFRLNNKLNDNIIPYSNIYRILFGIANGSLDMASLNSIKSEFGRHFIFDDSSVDGGLGGDARE